MHRVGIIGASGNAGKGAVSILKNRDDILLKLGCRHIEKLADENENCELYSVDVNREEELNAFVKNCDYVINCAGPSWKIMERVAKSCFQYHTVYIDVAGGQSFIHSLKMLEQAEANIGITSAGVYPGLSEIFLKWICEQSDGKIASIEEVFYGNDMLSDVALQDICESLKEDEGDAFCYCHNGEILKISFETKTSMKVPGVLNPIHLMPVMNPAFANVMGKYSIDKAIFYLGLLREESMSELIHLKSELKNHTSEEILSEETKSIFYSKEYKSRFGMMAEVAMRDSQGKERYVLSGETNWNYLTGAVAALALLNLEEKNAYGIRYVHEMVDAKKMILELKEHGLITVKKYVRIK